MFNTSPISQYFITEQNLFMLTHWAITKLNVSDVKACQRYQNVWTHTAVTVVLIKICWRYWIQTHLTSDITFILFLTLTERHRAYYKGNRRRQEEELWRSLETLWAWSGLLYTCLEMEVLFKLKWHNGRQNILPTQKSVALAFMYNRDYKERIICSIRAMLL